MEYRRSPVENERPSPLPTDQELADRIYEHLRDLSRLACRCVAVDVQQGVLTLRGGVPTYYMRQVVVHHCQQVPGVIAVIDELSVGD